MHESFHWLRCAFTGAAALGLLAAIGCTGQPLGARPTLLGATCTPTDGGEIVVAMPQPEPSASPFRSVSLLPPFAATCRPDFDMTRIVFASAFEEHKRPTFELALFGASCSPAARGFDPHLRDGGPRWADVPARPASGAAASAAPENE
jgi:hypothetical protein